MYAVVDIETTGGYAGANGITEIAVLLHNGMEVEGSYHTLINPQVKIPRYITALTGIDNAMVEGAPRFGDVAEHIYNLLQGRIFVAHNVNFDYSFIRHHLDASGYSLQARKLCTVRLSRKIFPGLPGYSLGNLCRQLGISIAQRHRAMGDAAATARLLTKLIAADREGVITKMLKAGSRESYLPLNLPHTDIDNLPAVPGVYYFHDAKDRVIYVGKAINLRKRVTSHFSNNAPSRRKQELVRNVYRISYQECGSAIAASVFESIEIKRLWPVYNYSQKKWEFAFGLCTYEDRNGIKRLAIERKRKNLQTFYSFTLLAEGHTVLRKLIREHGLCPRYCFLQSDDQPCEGHQEQTCRGICAGRESAYAYNQRVEEAITHIQDELPTFAILDAGRRMGEKSCLLMERGSFYGMGFIPDESVFDTLADLKAMLTPYTGNENVRAMMIRHAELYPERTLSFQRRGEGQPTS
jgi:DNA polymerase-3 subunit epsilon